MILFIDEINKSLSEDYRIEETLSVIEFKDNEEAYVNLYHKGKIISKIDIFITIHYGKLFCEMDSNTESEYRGKGYNTILRIIIILISKIIGINFIISVAASPMSKYILNKLNFISDVDESILYPNFVPYINLGNNNKIRNKNLYYKIIQEKYHMIEENDKKELLEFINNKSKNGYYPKLAIKKKFIEILTKNKQILLEYKTQYNLPYLFDYKYNEFTPYQVIDNQSNHNENITVKNKFTHYINLEKYNEIDNLKILLLTYLENSIDIIDDIDSIQDTINNIFLMFGGNSKKKKKYKSKNKIHNCLKKSKKRFKIY